MAKLNITWPQFAMCNDNPTKAFEDMCRRLFTADILKGKVRPHADHNNAGIEVLPILEPEREDGQPQKRISFQCKYADSPSYAYSEFQKSAKTTAKKYKGELDLVYDGKKQSRAKQEKGNDRYPEHRSLVVTFL